MPFTTREVPIGKNCALRPRAVRKKEGIVFTNTGPPRLVKHIFIFSCNTTQNLWKTDNIWAAITKRNGKNGSEEIVMKTEAKQIKASRFRNNSLICVIIKALKMASKQILKHFFIKHLTRTSTCQLKSAKQKKRTYSLQWTVRLSEPGKQI